MDFNNPRQLAAFLDLHSNNPREGPGNEASTLRALAAVTEEHFPRRVLDIGCGTGVQTRNLIDALLVPPSEVESAGNPLEVVALDRHLPYIDGVNQWAHDYPADTLQTVVADMRFLDLAKQFDNQPFDLIWCEGAAYTMGIVEALTQWRSLLSSPGYIAFSECVFLRTDLPEPVRRNWLEYPAMTTIDGVRTWVRDAGYELLDCFVLPPDAWWAYYTPLQSRVTELREKYADDPDGALVIAEGQSEIDVYREYSDYFGYVFYVVRNPDSE